VATLVAKLKVSSNQAFKGSFPSQFSWQSGYAAFSVAESTLESVVEYVSNQEEHHKRGHFSRRIPSHLATAPREFRRTVSLGLRCIFLPALPPLQGWMRFFGLPRLKPGTGVSLALRARYRHLEVPLPIERDSLFPISISYIRLREILKASRFSACVRIPPARRPRQLIASHTP
jgi:hypothetical protein